MPVELEGMAETLARLGIRPRETELALQGLTEPYTLFDQGAEKNLLPFAVCVAAQGGANATVFQEGNAKPSAWLYALQAATISVTVRGIWLGHVYHWHIVTAALQMTLLEKVPKDHPLSLLLRPQ